MTTPAKLLFGAVVALSVFPLTAQTLFVPGGTATGIANNTTSDYVGIGTTNPGFKLTVKDSSAGAGISVVDTNENNLARMRGLGAAGSQRGAIELYSAGALTSAIYSDGNSSFITGGGNVGIGTTSPAAQLDVNGGINISRNGAPLQFVNSLSGVPHTISSESSGNLTLASSGTTVYQNLYASGNRYNYFATSVGIGTTNPGAYKLAVVGKIRAQEIVVDTGWSDYVFEDSFKLKALSETEAFIKAEKHLPGIPSAQEVAEHGISVGEMQARLLAKIEELTLHVIAQEKEMSALRSEVESLKTTR